MAAVQPRMSSKFQATTEHFSLWCVYTSTTNLTFLNFRIDDSCRQCLQWGCMGSSSRTALHFEALLPFPPFLLAHWRFWSQFGIWKAHCIKLLRGQHLSTPCQWRPHCYCTLHANRPLEKRREETFTLLHWTSDSSTAVSVMNYVCGQDGASVSGNKNCTANCFCCKCHSVAHMNIQITNSLYGSYGWPASPCSLCTWSKSQGLTVWFTQLTAQLHTTKQAA